MSQLEVEVTPPNVYITKDKMIITTVFPQFQLVDGLPELDYERMKAQAQEMVDAINVVECVRELTTPCTHELCSTQEAIYEDAWQSKLKGILDSGGEQS